MDVTLLHPPFTSVLADTHHIDRHIYMNMENIDCVNPDVLGWMY